MMTSKLYVRQVLSGVSLSHLRQLAQEFNLDPRGTKVQLINRLLNPTQSGGADPDPGPDYWVIGSRLEAFLLNYIDSFSGELEVPMEQIKAALDDPELGFKYDYSPEEWYKILLPAKIINKTEQPYDVLPVFVKANSNLSDLNYSRLKLLTQYYPTFFNFDPETMETKRTVELEDLGRWSDTLSSISQLEISRRLNTVRNLRTLNFTTTNNSDSPLESLPESFGALSSLESLNLDGVGLKSLPESIGSLSNLKNLNISANPLKTLPDSFGALSKLEQLQFSEIPLLKSLPDSIGALSNLIRLHVTENPLLSSIPESIGNLTNLKDLELYGNPALRTLPNSLGNLTNLTSLDLSDNPALKRLPESIGNLTNLTYLDLHNTPVESFPNSFGDLRKLENLHLEESSLQLLPLAILNEFKERGTTIGSSDPDSVLASPVPDPDIDEMDIYPFAETLL